MTDERKDIRIHAVDFWKGMDTKSAISWLVHPAPQLAERFNFIIDAENPDYLLFSCVGFEHLRYTDPNLIKIYMTGENYIPNFNACDYATAHSHLQFGQRYLRVPNYFRSGAGKYGYKRLQQDLPPLNKNDLQDRTGFCCWVVSNIRYADPIRESFAQKLQERCELAIAGRSKLTNTDALEKYEAQGLGWETAKINWMRGFKFSLDLENCASAGYVTEKIMQSFMAHTIPVYWGAPDVALDFNPDAFINLADYPNFDAAIDYMCALAQDDEAYLAMLNQNPLANIADDVARLEADYLNFFTNIFKNPRPHRPIYGYAKNYSKNLRTLMEALKPPKQTPPPQPRHWTTSQWSR